jgi:serine/threonine-protein kinase RsbW
MNRIYKELKINSTLDNLAKVEHFVDEICEAYYVTNSYYGNIVVAIMEAVKNAVIHGNKNSLEKQVKICFKSIPKGLCFTIRDEGNGFNYTSIPSPIEVMNESPEMIGNGIYLIRTLADKVSYNRKGNSIEIIFYISSLNQETTLSRISLVHGYFNKQKSLV